MQIIIIQNLPFVPTPVFW